MQSPSFSPVGGPHECMSVDDCIRYAHRDCLLCLGGRIVYLLSFCCLYLQGDGIGASLAVDAGADDASGVACTLATGVEALDGDVL